jgi:hypothetical protein
MVQASDQSNAPSAGPQGTSITVTHPFHPLHGREFSLLSRTKNWGEDRVYFYDDAGRLKSLPASWTSLRPVDAFVALSGGRALFRPEDLLRLADLLSDRESGR